MAKCLVPVTKLLVAQPVEHFAEIVQRSQSSDDLHELKTQHFMWNQIRPSVRDLDSAPKHFVGCSRNSVPELSQKLSTESEYRVNRLSSSHVVLNGVQADPHWFGILLANFVETGYEKSACNPVEYEFDCPVKLWRQPIKNALV